MLFQVNSIDRLGLLSVTRLKQLCAEQMSYRKEPIGGLIIGELVLLRDSLLQQVDRLLRRILRVVDAGFSDQSADCKRIFHGIEACGCVGRQFSSELLEFTERLLRLRDSALGGKRRCLCIQIAAGERLEAWIWRRLGDHLLPSTEAHQDG